MLGVDPWEWSAVRDQVLLKQVWCWRWPSWKSVQLVGQWVSLLAAAQQDGGIPAQWKKLSRFPLCWSGGDPVSGVILRKGCNAEIWKIRLKIWLCQGDWSWSLQVDEPARAHQEVQKEEARGRSGTRGRARSDNMQLHTLTAYHCPSLLLLSSFSFLLPSSFFPSSFFFQSTACIDHLLYTSLDTEVGMILIAKCSLKYFTH